jgi:dihydrofolate synthase/folylpolyglutamate synthase
MRIVIRRHVGMTYPEAIEFLYGLQLFGSRPGLESTQKLAALAGNPHDRLRFIHVAGTNGKGSTCAMLESIYRASGLRVGLFTSPHLVSFSERIQVNRQSIPEAEVARRVEAMRPLLAAFTPETHPTFFEVVTVMALQHFAEQRCDLVILETGLGGRLDATNIVQPLASVITNVQFDHERWLGHTLAAIATEKAGIIKHRVPSIVGPLEPDALAVVQTTAQAQASLLTEVSPVDADRPPLRDIELPLPGQHQRLNALVALATVRVLADELPVSEAAVREGLERVNWPGRLQIVSQPNGQRLLLDGAHNPGGAATLRTALAELFPQESPALILGVRSDKEWQRIGEILAPTAHRVICVALNSEQTLDPAHLVKVCQQVNPQAKVEACPNVQEALAKVSAESLVVVSGSLYLIGEALETLHLKTSPTIDEKPLNEWLGPARK